MSYKVVLFLAFVAGVSCGGVLKDKSWLAGKSKLIATFTDNSTCPAIFSCLDCSTARLCRPDGKGGFSQIQTVACPGTAPFCDFATGTCTSVPDKSCGDKTDPFICLADGNFPDGDCKTYHVCQGYVATKFLCKDENYNAEKGICEKDAPCGSMTCVNSGTKVAHTSYPNYYAYCKSINAPAVIDRCPGKYELNFTSQVCEPTCHNTEGVQQDIEDCTKYYKCQYTWIQDTKIMLKTHLDCPKGTGFDPSNYICVALPSPSLPNCKPK